MMAILNRNQELPRDRPELYNQASRVLLHQWDVERALIEDARLDPKTIDYRDKQAMLRKVAYRMQSSEKGLAGNLISATDLEAILTDYLKTIEVEQARTVARLFINQLRTRNFILCFLGADSYGFVHRTFLEYFCAWEFVWQFKETQILTIERLIDEVFGAHWQDESWHEVLRLICGMIEPKFVAEIIEFLLKQKVDRSKFLDDENRLTKAGFKNIILSVSCFAVVSKKSEILSISNKLLKILKREIKYEIKQEYFPLFSTELAGTITSLIGTTWQDHPKTLIFLKRCVVSSSKFSFIPVSALFTIIQYWKNNSDILPWLTKTVIQGDNILVSSSVMIGIAEGWKEDPNTLRFLKDRALQDEDYNVREAALEAITEGWKEDPDTLRFLKDRALQDKNYNVRRMLVYPIIEDWKEDPDTLPFLKDLALQDEVWNVREAAIRAIIKNWTEDPELFEFLENIVINDPFKRIKKYQKNPRQIALEALLKNFSDNPKNLEILNQVALNDSDEKLREFAVQKLQDLKNANP
jgi:hypothetical protein